MDIGSTPCPTCGRCMLALTTRYAAKKVGTYSLAGVQMKFSMVAETWLVCLNCGVEAKAHK